jgi:hypothetical protein
VCNELPEPKPCPSWCTGVHDCITPDGECIHFSAPAILSVADSPLEVYIETYIERHAGDPPPGHITWDFHRAGSPSLTAREARSFITILDALIGQLEREDCAR